MKQIVADEIGCKVRSVELNVLQRAASHCSSLTDIEESFRLGANGVKLAMEGKSGVMSTAVRVSDEPYELEYGYAEISGIANYEKTVPAEWISTDGTDVTDEMIAYLRPLIVGENKAEYKNGMPDYIFID